MRLKSYNKRIVYPILILAVAAVLVAILVASKKPPEKKQEKNDAPFVEVEPVKLKDATLTVSSQGLVQPKYQTRLLAQVSGVINEVSDKFVRGGVVKKGEILAQIDPFDYEVRLQQSNATLASARAQFILERAQGRVAEAEWEKIANTKPSELGLRKPQQEQALAAVKAAQAGVRRASKDLERTRIIAPFNALITTRNISPGTFVNLGTDIGELVNIETAEVRLPVANDDMTFLNDHGIGAAVTLTAVVSGKPQQWQAAIVRDEGIVDNQSRMFYLVALITDPYQLAVEDSAAVINHRLPFGTYVTADIQGRSLKSVATVPRHLVKDNRVPLLADNKLKFAEVDVIRHQGKSSVIRAGLVNGDQLITSSLANPVEGMSLKANAGSEQSEEASVVSTDQPKEASPSSKES